MFSARRRRGLTLLLLLALSFHGMETFPGTAQAREPLRLTTGMREPWTTSDGTGFTDLLITEVFRRLDIPVSVSVNLAAARAIHLANDGIDDGLAARISGLEGDYPNLVRVAEPIFINDFIAATTGLKAATPDWQSLAPYGVGYILGWQIFDRNLGPVREVTHARDSAQLMTLLKLGRVEVVLHERWQALWHARQVGLRLQVQEPPLARVPMYIYLHNKHADLAPRVAATLVAMKADGSYQALMERAFAGLEGGGAQP